MTRSRMHGPVAGFEELAEPTGAPVPAVTSFATESRLLVATLLLRAAVNGVFALWLLARESVWNDIFLGGAVYAIVDGALGLTTSVLFIRHEAIGAPPMLVSIVLTDAVLRVSAGLAILAFPGISDFPITIVLFFGALGAWAAIAGVIAIEAWFLTRERKNGSSTQRRSRTHALFDPLAAAGLLAGMLAVYALIVGPPASAEALRVAGGAASGALGLVFLVAAFSVGADRGFLRASERGADG
jgi:hypothetical protein